MSYLLCSVLLLALSPLCRFTIEATHTNKKDDKVEEEHYTYLVGVCISAVDTDRFSGCGIVQYNATDHTKAVCVGKITSPQVSRSKSI